MNIIVFGNTISINVTRYKKTKLSDCGREQTLKNIATRIDEYRHESNRKIAKKRGFYAAFDEVLYRYIK